MWLAETTVTFTASCNTMLYAGQYSVKCTGDTICTVSAANAIYSGMRTVCACAILQLWAFIGRLIKFENCNAGERIANGSTR